MWKNEWKNEVHLNALLDSIGDFKTAVGRVTTAQLRVQCGECGALLQHNTLVRVALEVTTGPMVMSVHVVHHYHRRPAFKLRLNGRAALGIPIATEWDGAIVFGEDTTLATVRTCCSQAGLIAAAHATTALIECPLSRREGAPSFVDKGERIAVAAYCESQGRQLHLGLSFVRRSKLSGDVNPVGLEVARARSTRSRIATPHDSLRATA